MAFLSKSMTVEVNYAKEHCYAAMRSALLDTQYFIVKNENENLFMFELSVPFTFSNITWGDIVSVAFTTSPSGSTIITIDSTTKFPVLLAPVQQNRNIQALLNSFHPIIALYPPLDGVDATPTPKEAKAVQSNTKDQLIELKELFDSGLITEDEYTKLRTEVLASF